MRKELVNIYLFFSAIILEVYFVVNYYFILGNNDSEKNYILFGALMLTTVASFLIEIPYGFLLSIISVFIIGSYILYGVFKNDNSIIYDYSLYGWIFVYPLLNVTSNIFSSYIKKIIKPHLEEMEKLNELVSLDPLTKFSNEGQFYRCLNEEIAKSKRYKYAFSVMYIKIMYYDEFKRVYDKKDIIYIIEELVIKIQNITRIEDRKFALGEGQFTVTLSHTNAEGADILKDRLRDGLSHIEIKSKNKVLNLNLKFKICVVQYNEEEHESSFDLVASLKKELEFDV